VTNHWQQADISVRTVRGKAHRRLPLKRDREEQRKRDHWETWHQRRSYFSRRNAVDRSGRIWLRKRWDGSIILL